MDLNSCLPQVSEIKLRPWALSYGGDYYGALQVAAEYCELSDVPQNCPGAWQHGAWPPWMLIRPEITVYDAPKSTRCFVARQDEVEFLRRGGYRKAQAIGLPMIYTQSSGLRRIPNSLLVMPTHSLESDTISPSTEQYVREVASIRRRFSVVAAAVSAYCLDRGLWASEFERSGIQALRGAGIRDGNALKRLRALFDTFEYMTTDRYGSHVFYALLFGVKVSIWGTATPLFRENVVGDGGWTAYPEAIDALLSEETERKAERYLGPFRVEPWNGKQDVQLGESILGYDNKLSPEQMRAAFRWTPTAILADKALEASRRSLFWRAGSAVKRRLLAAAKS